MIKVFTAHNLSALPPNVQELIAERETARANHDFARSDALRNQIKALGFIINDNSTGYELLSVGDSSKSTANSYLVLFGSGEIAPSSVDIYRSLFLTLGKRDLNIALITTPAGFQPNVQHVYGEIKEFFLKTFPDFNIVVTTIYANQRSDADNQQLVDMLSPADVIFCGPGSPTYAVKNLQGTLLYKQIISKVGNGTTLILASAATLAFSRHCLPIYEIYKVGEDLHWINGLDFFDSPLTIIPHFNNREGGNDLDTTHCYIGKDRGEKLLKLLPPGEKVIGIDEHTAYIINQKTGQTEVKGKGRVTPLS
jgi:cyanophycinase-like exopeptidase